MGNLNCPTTQLPRPISLAIRLPKQTGSLGRDCVPVVPSAVASSARPASLYSRAVKLLMVGAQQGIHGNVGQVAEQLHTYRGRERESQTSSFGA